MEEKYVVVQLECNKHYEQAFKYEKSLEESDSLNSVPVGRERSLSPLPLQPHNDNYVKFNISSPTHKMECIETMEVSQQTKPEDLVQEVKVEEAPLEEMIVPDRTVIPKIVANAEVILQSILNQLVEVKEIARQNSMKIDMLQLSLGKGKIRAPVRALDVLSNCTPLNDVANLKVFEQKLLNEEISLQMVAQLTAIGGKNDKDATKRCLTKMFSNRLAKDCSWNGIRNNHKLCDLKTMKNIFAAVRKNFPQCLEQHFEVYCKEWFRHAKQRYLRTQVNIQ